MVQGLYTIVSYSKSQMWLINVYYDISYLLTHEQYCLH